MTDADNLIRQLDEKDAKIAALQQNDANREALLDLLLRLRNEYVLEIAALRAELQHAQGALTAESNLHAESEERDLAEIAALRVDNALLHDGIDTRLSPIIDGLEQEIAALREAVRDIDGFIGTSPTNQLTEWHRWEKLPAVIRSLEEKT